METKPKTAPRFHWGQTVFQCDGSTVTAFTINGMYQEEYNGGKKEFVYTDARGNTRSENQLFANRAEVETHFLNQHAATMASVDTFFNIRSKAAQA